MRNLCLVFAITVKMTLAAAPSAPVEGAKTMPDSSKAGSVPTPAVTAPAAAATSAPADTSKVSTAPADTSPAPAAEVVEPAAPAAPADVAATPATAAAPAALATSPKARPVFNDYGLAGKQYLFGVLGQTVAATLGFFIGSAIETAIVGDEDAHKGTLSFTGIRYDNGYGAFWGGSTGALLGSSLTVYFTGQSDEEDGGLFWTLVGTGLAGGGALYLASAMGVNDDVDWKPFLPLLAIPSAGGVVGFNVSRWFSDRKRESIMGPDAGIHLHAPRFGWMPTPEGDRFQLQALNLSF